jgi:hypothetical protein
VAACRRDRGRVAEVVGQSVVAGYGEMKSRERTTAGSQASKNSEGSQALLRLDHQPKRAGR